MYDSVIDSLSLYSGSSFIFSRERVTGYLSQSKGLREEAVEKDERFFHLSDSLREYEELLRKVEASKEGENIDIRDFCSVKELAVCWKKITYGLIDCLGLLLGYEREVDPNQSFVSIFFDYVFSCFVASKSEMFVDSVLEALRKNLPSCENCKSNLEHLDSFEYFYNNGFLSGGANISTGMSVIDGLMHLVREVYKKGIDRSRTNGLAVKEEGSGACDGWSKVDELSVAIVTDPEESPLQRLW